MNNRLVSSCNGVWAWHGSSGKKVSDIEGTGVVAKGVR